MAANICKQENIGGGGDNMSILRSEGDQLAGKCFVEDGEHNDYVLVPADAVTAISGGDNDEQTASNNNMTDMNNLSLLAVKNEPSLTAEVLENIDDQHQEPLSTESADVVKDDVTPSITTEIADEQPSCENTQSSLQASSSDISSQMEEESGNVASPLALPVEDSTLQQEEAQHITEDSTTTEMVSRQDLQNSLQQDNQPSGPQEAVVAPSLIEVAPSLIEPPPAISLPAVPNDAILHTTSLPSFSPLKAPDQSAEVQVTSLQPHNNQSSLQQGDNNSNHIIDDPASFCQQEKLATVSSLSPFQRVPHQSANNSLPGINSFHQAAGVNGGLTMPGGLPTNYAGNMVYAAVPLQQTATGMQMAHLQPHNNPYTLARPKAAARRALLPRGPSASEATKVSSFKGKITPLTFDKPNVGLVQQIMEVFRAVGKKEMQPCEVYDGLQCCYPYYLHLNPNRKKSWMSSVRHALTTPCFQSRRSDDSDGKLASRKGSFWSINTSYNPDEKPLKRPTPSKRQVGNSPNYRRRPLGIDAEQANWHPFRRPQNRSARHNPYGYFSPTRGSFSPGEPSNSIPMMYSPPNVYHQQTPTAALLPNGKMIYLSPADETIGHQNQREMYHSWSADSSSPNLWQVVQNMGNENCIDQQNRAIYSIANQQQQPQGSMNFTAHPTAANNINCNNATTTTQSSGTKTTIRPQKQLTQQELLQQQLLQQHFQQQQQLIQQQQQQQLSQQQASLVTDPFAAAMELSDIKSSMETEENDQTPTCEAAWKVATQQSEAKPQQDMGTSDSSNAQQCTVEVPISTAEQFMGFGNTQNTQQLTPAGTVNAPSQQGCDDLRTMVYQSLGVCNVQGARPEGILSSSSNVGSNPSVTQLSTMPSTQYQLLHYSNTSQQY